MDLFFNELSLNKTDCISHDSIIAIVEVYRELTKYNITTCRIASEDNTRLFQMISNTPNSINVRNFYFSFFRSPYESDQVEKNQEDYYGHSWTYGAESCIGFALAYLLDSACFSIYSQEWNLPLIRFLKDEVPTDTRNICTKEHVKRHITHLRHNSEIELLPCGIPVSDKKIVLRNDHGMDVLEDFSKRLIHCPYLTGVINSLPYNPYERKFIKKICENGLIEIVLPWTDEGYGIVVKTTGRTMLETEKIAKIIEDEYGYI